MERYNKTVETATNSLEGMTNPWDKQISTYLGFLHSTNNDNQLRAEAAITTYHDLFAIPIHIDNPLSTNAEVVKQYIGESLFNYARDVSAALEQPSSSLSSFSNSLRNQYLAALEVAQFVDCGLTHFLEAQNIDELHDILSVKSRMQDAIGLFLHALEKNRFCQRSDLQQSVEYTLLRLIRVSLLKWMETQFDNPDPQQHAVNTLLLNITSSPKLLLNAEDIRQIFHFNPESLKTDQLPPLQLASSIKRKLTSVDQSFR